jgi:acetyl esterase
MPLDADAAELLATIKNKISVLRVESGLSALRAADAEVASWNDRDPVPRVESFEITSGSEQLRVRLYAHAEGPAPTVIFFHGGGFVAGSIETHDALVRQLVLRSGWAALSVGYRLAPEHRFPAALDDAYAALSWAAGPEARRRGVDARNLVVCGASAGANIAAALAILARDRGGPEISRQILLYPPLDHRCETQSHLNTDLQCQLTTTRVKWYWEQYLGPSGDYSDSLAAPALCADVSHLPEATVVTCEYDPLRDEAESYTRRLIAAGGSATYNRFNGVYHGFMNFPSLQRAQEALDYVSASLQQTRAE